MIFRKLVQEFVEYSQTQDYVHGVFVELTGTIIEIILLLILLPIVLYIIRKFQTRRVRATVDFYLFQIFHKVTGILLAMMSTEDISPILEEEQKKDRKFVIFSHHPYGNLENKLFVLNKLLSEKEKFRQELKKRTLDDFEKYARICEKCMDEVDRLITIFVRLPGAQKDLLNTRAAIYPLRDITYQIIEDIRRSDKEPDKWSIDIYSVEKFAKGLIKFIGITFQKRKKLIDSAWKHHYYLRFFRQWVLPLPYVLVRRRISIWICRLKKKPYRDPVTGSYVSDYLVEWRTKNGFSIQQAAEILGMPEKEYRDYEYGYRKPSEERYNPMRKHLRGEVDYSQLKKGTE
jgi:hypothetical protein